MGRTIRSTVSKRQLKRLATDAPRGEVTLRALRVDASYRNTSNWKHPSDVFNRFFRFADGKGITNSAGFRPKSRARGATDIRQAAFCVLVTTFREIEWPDELDRESGTFTYYGDNRAAGRQLDATTVGGNRLLERVFTDLHLGDRATIPPFLCFEKCHSSHGTVMKFLGLACPGASGVSGLEDLVAVWRVQGNDRFHNYRATFTILNAETVSHAWLQDLVDDVEPADSANCPDAWSLWVKSGTYASLRCVRQQSPRSREEQMPSTADETAVLDRVFNELTPREFEFFVAGLLPILDERFIELRVTSAVRDGGRDIIARYRVGHQFQQVQLKAYVEAKRWRPNSAVGVKPMMRLLARLKHRDLGVFVTTSFFEQQVQRELVEDNHPVLLVSGGDIARILIGAEYGGPESDDRLTDWFVRLRAETRGVTSD